MHLRTNVPICCRLDSVGLYLNRIPGPSNRGVRSYVVFSITTAETPSEATGFSNLPSEKQHRPRLKTVIDNPPLDGASVAIGQVALGTRAIMPAQPTVSSR